MHCSYVELIVFATKGMVNFVPRVEDDVWHGMAWYKIVMQRTPWYTMEFPTCHL